MARRGAMTRAPALRGQARRDFKAQRAAQQAQPVPAPQQPMAPAQPQPQMPAPQPQSGALSGALAGAMQSYNQMPKQNPREQWLQQQKQQWRSQELTPEEANMQIPVGGGFMGDPNYYSGQGQSPMAGFQQIPPDKMYRFPQPAGGPQMANAIGAVAGDYQQAVVPDQSMQQQQFRRMPMPMPNRRLY